jgi:hypothetical protein
MTRAASRFVPAESLPQGIDVINDFVLPGRTVGSVDSRKRGSSRFRNRSILLGRAAGNADGTDELAINHQRHAAAENDEPRCVGQAVHKRGVGLDRVPPNVRRHAAE